jgi:two-component system sensor histidine kinase/response regulator
VTGMLATFTDITELREAAAALEIYAQDLEAQNAELDAFAHTVAHDLKNPLTSLIGFSSILSQKFRELPEDTVSHHIGFIARSAQTMNNIVRELLLLASVREKQDIPVTILSMEKIVGDVLQRLEFLISESRAVINLPESWPQALGYGPWIAEVWMNYISNGIKYGGYPEQLIAPQLELGAETTDIVSGLGGYMVRFWIKDNGQGISAEDREQLFTPFERLHNVHTEGHGLGLSIVQRIVEKLGGKVGVDSTFGQGSTFNFTLPAVPDNYTEEEMQ